MDSALSEALAPVLRDLENSGALLPDVRDRQWSDVPGQMTAMLYGPDPEHPGSHPLAAQLRDHRAAWACPKTGILICLVGELAA